MCGAECVLMKIVAGTNGDAAAELAEAIGEQWPLTAQEVYDLAVRNDFGGPEDLVVIECDQVMDPRLTTGGERVVLMGGAIVFTGSGQVPSSYRETFLDPDFNPRWEDGSADHKYRVNVENKIEAAELSAQAAARAIDDAAIAESVVAAAQTIALGAAERRAEGAELELAKVQARILEMVRRCEENPQYQGTFPQTDRYRHLLSDSDIMGKPWPSPLEAQQSFVAQGGTDCHWYGATMTQMTTACGRTGVRGVGRISAVTCEECMAANPCDCGHGRLWHHSFGVCTFCDECPVYDAVLKEVMSGDKSWVPKTIPIEIAVAVTGTKELGAAIVHAGDRGSARNFALELLGEESELEHVVFVKVDVPLPKEVTVEGTVVEDE